jgi:hypothetical protein
VCVCAFQRSGSRRVSCVLPRGLSGQQTRMAEAAFTNNNVAWPRSDPDVFKLRSDSRKMQPAVNGWIAAPDVMRRVPLRRCDAFVTIRAGDVAVTTIRADGSGKRPRTFFGPIQLAIGVEAAHIRSAGAIQRLGRALCFGQSTSPSPASCPSPEPELPGPAWARLTGFLHATGRI